MKACRMMMSHMTIKQLPYGNSDKCDYLVVGSKNPIAAEYEIVSDEQGFLVSRKRQPKNI